MPCSVDISPNDETNHFQVLLCQACKYLSYEAIRGLKNPGSGIIDGLEWYCEHLGFDYFKKCHNEDSLDFDYDTNEEEKKLILNELKRIGFNLILTENYMELVKI